MTLKYHTNGSRMFVCAACDKHLDLDDNEGGHYSACKDHVMEVAAICREEERKRMDEKYDSHKRHFELFKEVQSYAPACPYCFKEYEEWWESFKDEDEYTTDLECGYCDKTFKAQLRKEYSFTTTRIEDNE